MKHRVSDVSEQNFCPVITNVFVSNNVEYRGNNILYFKKLIKGQYGNGALNFLNPLKVASSDSYTTQKLFRKRIILFNLKFLDVLKSKQI